MEIKKEKGKTNLPNQNEELEKMMDESIKRLAKVTAMFEEQYKKNTEALEKNQKMPQVRIGHGLYTENLSTKAGKELINLIWSRPNFAQVELTKNCNFKCKFCFENCDVHDKYQDKPPEMWKKVIDELYNLGIKKIHFSGGENFLYKHFKEILKYSKEKGLTNLINTNASIDSY